MVAGLGERFEVSDTIIKKWSTGDKGGDPVSLVAYLEGVSQSEAARRLARMLGKGGSHN